MQLKQHSRGRKMKKLFIAMLLISNAAQAVGLEDQPFTLHCQGSNGSVLFEHTETGIAYDVQLPDQKFKGFVLHDMESHRKWESAFAFIIDSPSYAPHDKYLSMNASYGDKIWQPASWECAPTRVPDKCDHIKKPGYYGKFYSEYLDFMVDITDINDIKFMRFSTSGVSIETLGDNTICSLSPHLTGDQNEIQF
jgi:hypothetical protein